ncbi:enoyl-CoA hydratase-related protein [Nocardioides pyridinolyticus]
MSEVDLHVVDGLATITLNAPERRNALTVAMSRELIAACDTVDADPSVGAVVVVGAGDYFCAGAERATLARAGERPADTDMYEAMAVIYRSFKRVGELKPPTVAAVRGGAVGAGMNLALATDLRVVAVDARLTSGFLAIGLHQGGGHGALLARTSAREAGNAMTMFGESISGSRAAELGLAWEALPSEGVLTRARELALAPASDPELARYTARAMRLQSPVGDTDWDRGLDLERANQMWSLRRRHLGTPSR